MREKAIFHAIQHVCCLSMALFLSTSYIKTWFDTFTIFDSDSSTSIGL